MNNDNDNDSCSSSSSSSISTTTTTTTAIDNNDNNNDNNNHHQTHDHTASTCRSRGQMPEGGLLALKLSPYRTSKSPSQLGGGPPPSAAGLRWIVKKQCRSWGR